LIIFTFTYVCTHYLGHFSTPLPLIPMPLQNLLHPLPLRFCWRKNIKDKKKNIAFLLVWDEVSSTGRFFVLFLYIYILQPKLVHLYQTSSLLSSPFPTVASASLRLLYSFLYSEHINYIQVLCFLPFPYPSHVQSPLTLWAMSKNITAFVLGL
jgi:hypothetical protein